MESMDAEKVGTNSNGKYGRWKSWAEFPWKVWTLKKLGRILMESMDAEKKLGRILMESMDAEKVGPNSNGKYGRWKVGPNSNGKYGRWKSTFSAESRLYSWNSTFFSVSPQSNKDTMHLFIYLFYNGEAYMLYDIGWMPRVKWKIPTTGPYYISSLHLVLYTALTIHSGVSK